MQTMLFPRCGVGLEPKPEKAKNPYTKDMVRYEMYIIMKLNID